jgi:hypothetical protein
MAACCRDLPAPPLETLTHAFLECPAAAPAMRWLVDTWAHLTVQPPPPLSAQLLLADDHRVWAQPPAARAYQLWTRLRVATVGALWRVRCRAQASHPQESPARQAVRLAIESVVEAINRDWLRTQQDIRQLDDGAFCISWWRGFDSSLTVSQFIDQWAFESLLCEVEGETPVAGAPDTRRMVLRLGVDQPLPWPV